MHIALSGRLGSGKSTVAKILQAEHGFEIYSTGKIQRGIAEKMGITTLELNLRMENDPKLDFEIDNAVAEISRRKSGERILFDSRMAWHFAENAFKVYLYVDPTVAAERVVADNRGSVENYKNAEDARDKLIARAKAENQRYMQIYGVDNLDFCNYDLIVDTTRRTPEEVAAIIYKAYEKASEG